ncbi:copine-8 [Anaeramoeba flamelloides]|uniref:Copine-8 n=1 Tax=Anaeramoeba flamelloides TaxID=1746091 RepID=A0ABQ8YR63_9EUKA|nr:copine-8 [Anaeramoeba flamelloides]
METSSQNSKINITISAKDLPQNGSCAILVIQEEDEWRELGRTEFQSSKKPKFQESLIADFEFGQIQNFRIILCSHQKGLFSEGFGYVQFTLGELIVKHRSSITKQLLDPTSNKSTAGIVSLIATEIKKENLDLSLRWRCKKIKKLSNKSSAYLKFYAIKPKGEKIKIYKTLSVSNAQDLKWDPKRITTQELCKGDENNEIFVELWEQKSEEKEKLFAVGSTLLQKIVNEGNDFQLPLIAPSNQNKKKAKALCVLQSYKFMQQIQNSLFDFFSANISLSLSFAVDFTASNGRPEFPKSLHFLDPPNKNVYESVISLLGNSLIPYMGAETMIPCFGFGGKINTLRGNQDSICFPLNGNTENPECDGLEGVLSAYENALKSVALHGPTSVTNIIQGITYMTKQQGDNKYTVLVIITDGVPIDINQTRKLISKSAKQAMSVIFIGVGDEDFDELKDICEFNSKKSTRDNCKFVLFDKKMKNNPKLFVQKSVSQISPQILQRMRINQQKPNKILMN